MRLMLALCFCDKAYLHAVFLRLTWTNFVSLWPTTFWPLVVLCDASIYVCAVFLQRWKTRQILLAYLDKHILASSDSLWSLHLVSCYALATMTIPFHGLIGSGTCSDMHRTPYINNQESSPCNGLFHPVVSSKIRWHYNARTTRGTFYFHCYSVARGELDKFSGPLAYYSQPCYFCVWLHAMPYTRTLCIG